MQGDKEGSEGARERGSEGAGVEVGGSGKERTVRQREREEERRKSAR
jgi:hypothetical protein